jgi:hypothetical protein
LLEREDLRETIRWLKQQVEAEAEEHRAHRRPGPGAVVAKVVPVTLSAVVRERYSG